MNKYCKIIICFLLVVSTLLFCGKNIASFYVYTMVGKIPAVQEYTNDNYQKMSIIGEDYGEMMQIDGMSDEERKKVSVLYQCKIFCEILAVGIYEDRERNIVYGEVQNTDWIENWG